MKLFKLCNEKEHTHKCVSSGKESSVPIASIVVISFMHDLLDIGGMVLINEFYASVELAE